MSDNGTRKLIHAFEKNGRGEQVQIALQWFRGRQYVDVRLFFPDKLTGEPRPCQKGVALAVEHLDELLHGLMQARKLVDGVDHGRTQ
jgi:predicted transcriptional regulator